MIDDVDLVGRIALAPGDSDALPLGGAYTGQGTTMSIGAVPWGVAVPGPGRSLYAGLNVPF